MLHAGAATAVITPDLPVALAGYGDRTGPAEDVHDDLEARVLVLDDGERRVGLVTVDLLAMTADVAGPLRDAVAEALGATVDAVVVSCTHTHAGPSTLTGAEVIGWPVPPGYPDRLRDRTASAAAAAVEALAPVHGRFARGPLGDGVAVDRRGHPHAPTIGVLHLTGRDGAGVATVVNLGIHPTVSGPANRSVTTDWVGPFRAAVEAALGGTALFLQGCQGDVNPALEWDRDDPTGWVEPAAALGRELAGRAVATLDAGPTPLDDAGPGDITGPVVVRPARRVVAEADDTLLAALDGGAGPREATLQVVAVGDLEIRSVPGEAFHAVEADALATLGPRVLLAGLGPHWCGYLPCPYGEGYEESLSYGPGFTSAVLDALTG